jgi:hypothetical protein
VAWQQEQSQQDESQQGQEQPWQQEQVQPWQSPEPPWETPEPRPAGDNDQLPPPERSHD